MRAILRGGHVPGAVNIPYEENWVDPDTAGKLSRREVANNRGMSLKSDAELRSLYSRLDASKETIVYCQSGVRSAETATVLGKLGFRNVKVYDSSWLGYAAKLDAPVEKGCSSMSVRCARRSLPCRRRSMPWKKRSPLLEHRLRSKPCDDAERKSMKLRRRQFLHLAGAVALPALSCIAWAQAYPTRPVRLIVGFPPGGVADVFARLIGQWLSERLGQPLIIENRPGAGGNL